MCGKLCHCLEDSILFSTDSDCIIHAYPNYFYNLNYHYIVNTKKLFDLFDIKVPAYLPPLFGCDYM